MKIHFKNTFVSIAILLLFVSSKAFSQTLDIDIKNIKNDGQVCIAVFNSADKFYQYRNQKNCLIKDSKVKFFFEDVTAGSDLNKKINLKSGVYAIRVFVDKNFNKIIDRGFLGLRRERIGYSNNPTILFGDPYFSEIEFGLSSYKKIDIIL